MEGQRTSGDAPAVDGAVSTRDVMTREYVGVSESDTVSGAVDLLLSEDASAAVVLRGADPVGTLSVGDALAHLHDGADGDAPVETAMSESAPRVPPDESVFEAAAAMADADVDCLLVVEAGDVVGVVTDRDLVGATASLVNQPGTRPAGEAGPARTEGSEERTDDYATQSVCEACGSLTPDLSDFNGQLVCADCRDI